MRMIHLDEGPKGWVAGRLDITREDVGYLPVSLLRDPSRVDLVRSKENMTKTDETFQELYESMKENGYIGEPVLVAVFNDGQIEITDGTHRLLVAEMLGINEVPVRVLYLGNAQKNKKNILGEF